MSKKKTANDALRELDYDTLKQVFDSLMSTDRMFWDLLDYVVENDDSNTIAYEYMIDKLLNDCPAKEILEEINQY